MPVCRRTEQIAEIGAVGRPVQPPAQPPGTRSPIVGGHIAHRLELIAGRSGDRGMAQHPWSGFAVPTEHVGRQPREIANFVAGLPEKLYIESYGNYVRMEDVFVDSRGYIYVTGGAQQGIYILRYTGPVKN